MGFTPRQGLVLPTRAGSIDPGLVLWLQRHAGLSEAEMMDALDRYSGLQALAGTGDMRQLLEKLSAGDEHARLAFDVYVHRLRAGIASMAAAMAGMDVLVFTGGVGENASPGLGSFGAVQARRWRSGGREGCDPRGARWARGCPTKSRPAGRRAVHNRARPGEARLNARRWL